MYFYDKNKSYLWGFGEFRTFFVIFRRFFENFSARDGKVRCNTVKYIQQLSRVLIGLLDSV